MPALQNKPIAIISAIFGIIILILLVFAAFPLYKSIEKKSLDYVAAKETAGEIKRKIEGRDKSEEVYRAIENDYKNLDSLFVDADEPLNIIEFWENLAKENNLEVAITPIASSPAKSGEFDSAGFQISLVGPFEDVVKFIQKTENSPYLAEIIGLKIKKLPAGDVGDKKINPKTVDARITVKAVTK